MPIDTHLISFPTNDNPMIFSEVVGSTVLGGPVNLEVAVPLDRAGRNFTSGTAGPAGFPSPVVYKGAHTEGGELFVREYEFTCADYTGALPRTGSIFFTLFDSDGTTIEDVGTFELYQEAAPSNPTFVVNPSSISLTSSVGITKQVTASMQNTGSTMSVTFSASSWINVILDHNEAVGDTYNKYYNLIIGNNSSPLSRTGSVVFTLETAGTTLEETVVVTQPGVQSYPSLSLSPASVVFPSSEVCVVAVTASIENPGDSVTLTPSGPNWVTINPNTTSQVGSTLIKTYFLTASFNQGASSRESFVSFSLETSGQTIVKSIDISQPGRASVSVPTVNWAANLFEFESEGASVGTAAYVSGTVEGNIRVTGDHTPTVNYNTTNNVVTASIQFNVPANTLSTTRSTYMTISAWNSAGTASSVLEIRTAGTGEPTPVLPSGSIVVESGNHITASANANSTNFTVRYVNAEAGQYTIDGAGGFSGMDNPVSQSTIIDGNDIVVTYTATFPNNLEAYPVTRRAAFQMHRGDEYVYGQADIYQEGIYAPGGAGVVIQNTPVSVAANVTQITLFVTYSNALQDPWVIHYPSFSLGAYLIDSTSRDSGQDTIRTYTVGFPANQTTNPVTHSAFFKMSYGQYHDEDTGYIYQAAASPSPSTYAISCSWDYYDAGALQEITRTIKVRYDGGQYPDDFVGNPITSSNITALSATPLPSSDPAYCEINYSITAINNGENATVTFNIPGAGVTKTVTIHFSGAPDPGTPDIVVPGNPFNIASGDQIVTFTATYKNSYPGWTVQTAGTSKSDMHIVSSSVQVIGSDQQVTYEVTFPGNAEDLPVERMVFLLMTSGSGATDNERKTQNVRITQAGRLQVGTITLQPSRAWVAYSDTQSTFFATYSFNGLAYEIQNPVGYQCNVTTVDTRTLENGDQVYQYRVTFPTNPSTSTPVSRSVDCRMTTGSITAIETYIVAQDYQGGGGSKQILVNPTSKWIEHDQVTATTQVTYMGFSSAAQVSTPSCPSGWTATVGNVQESSGQVVINWIFTGTPNTGSGTKTNTFSIGASGATTKTFTIFQYGTGGGGGGGTERTSPVWKRNIISSSAASSRLRVTYSNQEIFNERVYAAPDSDHVEVDLNKICDPFVTHPNFWNIEDMGYDQPLEDHFVVANYPVPRFEASFDSGENYVSYVYNNRNYNRGYDGLTIDYSGVSLLTVSPYRTDFSEGNSVVYNLLDKMGRYQLIVFPVRNLTSSPVTVTLSTPRRTNQLTIPARTLGICWCMTFTCGDYTLTYNNTTFKKTVTSGYDEKSWSVYFWNSLGGLDALSLHGPVIPSIEVTRNNYLQGIYNYTRSYLNGVVDRWRCNTGIVPDELSPMVREMIASPEVALLEPGTLRAYVTRPITNSIEEKTFWNQGRKFVTYQFDLESILTQERR